MTFNSYGLGAFSLVRVGTTNEWTATEFNDQGATFTASIIVNMTPALCIVQFTMVNGDYAGEVISGTTPGWDGTNMWDTVANVLTATQPFFAGTVDLHVP